MGAILPFPVRHAGDWSESERARLDELAARFADQAGVEVVFGRSDSGDPWCVVLDAHDEVLVHVAREQGDVVVHAAAPDVIVRAPDLRTAVDRVLGSRWLEERADVVVPFASGSRAMQVVTAVLIVGSFSEHHRAEAEPADDWIFAPTRQPKTLARDGQRDDAAKVALAADAAPPIEHAPDLSPSNPRGGEAGQPFGTSFDRPVLGDDMAATSGGEIATWLIAESTAPEASSDVIVGTAGNDDLDGGQAPPGRHDLLDGGAGDDRLILDGGTIAIGGDGADRFLLRAPEVAMAGELALLGIVVDFEAGVDMLLTSGGSTFTIVASAPTRNIFADPNLNLGALPELPGQQLFADLDGDGRADGYVLVNGAAPTSEILDGVRNAVDPIASAPPTIITEPPTAPLSPAPKVDPADEAAPDPIAPTPVEFVDRPTADPIAEAVTDRVAERPAETAAMRVAEPQDPPVSPPAKNSDEPDATVLAGAPDAERIAEPGASESTIEIAGDGAGDSGAFVRPAEPVDESVMLVSAFESSIDPMPSATVEVI